MTTLSVGDKLSGTVTHVEFDNTSCYGFCQICDEAVVVQLAEKIEESIKAGVSSGNNLCVDDTVLALFHEDETWYRGRIIEKGDNSMSVFFIDFGNTEDVPKTDIRELPASLSNQEPLATECCFVDYIPKSGQWTDAEQDALKEKLLNEDFTVEVIGCQNDCINVRLHSHSDNMVSTVNNIKYPEIRLHSKHQCYLSYIESANKFWVQVKDSENELNDLMADIAEYCSGSPEKLAKSSMGNYCLTYYSEDEAPYRSVILTSTSDRCLVQFIDYGNSESKAHADLMALPTRFMNLSAQGIRCCYKTTKINPNKLEDLLQELSSSSDGVNVKFISKVGDEYTVEIDEIESLSRKTSTSGTVVEFQHEYPVSSFDLNKMYDICISHVVHPGKFFVQLIKNADDVHELMDQAEEEFITNKILSDPETKSSCIAKLSDGGFYRCVVNSIGSSVDVTSVDFGFNESISTGSLKEISLALQSIPAQCLQCTVDLTKVTTDYWSDEEVEKLKQFENGIPIVAMVTSQRNGAYQLDLYDTRDPDIDRYINEELLGIKKMGKSASAYKETVSMVRKPLIIRRIQIPEPDVSIGGTELVCVTALKSTKLFYAQLTKFPIEKVAALQENIFNVYEMGQDPLHEGEVGVFCCAKYVDGSWYRALITNVIADKAEVMFIDFGDSCTLSLADLKQIHPSVADTPQLCILCQFYKNPPGLSFEEIQALLLNKVLEVKLVSKADGVYPTFQIELTNHSNNRAVTPKLFGTQKIPRLPQVALQGGYGNKPNRTGEVNVGDTEEVMVTHVVDPEHFHIQLSKTAQELETLMDQIEKHCSSLGEQDEVLQDVTLGKNCVAKYSADQDWYRARVTGLLANGLVEVLFIDYGNTECCAKETLKEIKTAMLSLSPQAIFCGLEGISSPTGFWQPENIAQFEDLVLDQTFKATFKSFRSGENLYLCDLQSSDGTNINQKYGRSTNSLTTSQSVPTASDDNPWSEGNTGSKSFQSQSSGRPQFGRSNDRGDRPGFGGSAGGGRSFGSDNRSSETSGFGSSSGGSRFDGSSGGGSRSGFGESGGNKSGFGSGGRTGFGGSGGNKSGFGGGRSGFGEKSESTGDDDWDDSGEGSSTSRGFSGGSKGFGGGSGGFGGNRGFGGSGFNISGQNRGSGSSKGCHKCGEEGHFARDCPSSGGSNKGGGRGCHKCGEEGHFARDCPSGGGGSGGGRGCHKCGEEGHFARDCPSGGSSRGGGSKGCHKCGEEGHFARDCTNQQSSGFGGGGRSFGDRGGGSSGFGNRGGGFGKSQSFGSKPSGGFGGGSSQASEDDWGNEPSSSQSTGGFGGKSGGGGFGGRPSGKPSGGFGGNSTQASEDDWGDGLSSSQSTGSSGGKSFGGKPSRAFGGRSTQASEDDWGDGLSSSQSTGGFGGKPSGSFGGYSGRGFGGKSRGGNFSGKSSGGGFGGKSQQTFASDDWDSPAVSVQTVKPGQPCWSATPKRKSADDEWEHDNSDSYKITRFNVNSSIKVYVVYTKTPGEFWCQLVSKSESLEQMMEDLNEEYKNLFPKERCIQEMETGLPCVAKFSEDDRWYRAEIFSVNTDGKIGVHFVDYGNNEIVEKTSIKGPNVKFMNLEKQAVKCRLDEAFTQSGTWSIEAAEKFEELVMDKELTAEVVNFSSGLYVIRLKDGDVDIAKSLREAGLCEIKVSTSTSKTVTNQYQSLSYNKGDTISGYVSWIENPHSFWIQPEKEQESLEKLVGDIQEFYETDGYDLSDADVGAAVIAKFTEDEAWYRAFVENVQNEKFQVRFVDYGNSDSLPLTSLKQITSQFLTFPAQAVCCSLSGVKPLQSQWTADSKDIMQGLITDDTVVSAEILTKDDDGRWLVTLKANEIDVAEELVSAAVVRQVASESQDNMSQTENIPFFSEQSPLCVGSEYKVFVSHVNSSNSFYCQLLDSLDALDTVMADIEEHALSSKEVRVPSPGMACMAQYSGDDAWYRSQVTSVKSSQSDVSFVDYGNCERVEQSKIHHLKPEHLKLPPQAIHCSLLSKDAFSDFKNLVMEKEMSVKVLETSPTITVVNMYDEEGKSVCDLIPEQCTETSEDKQPTKQREECVTFEKVFNLETQKIPDEKVQAFVSHQEGGKCFYLQLAQDEDRLGELIENIQCHCEKTEAIQDIEVGEYCCAQFSADDSWYRASVKSKTADQVDVMFVDFGNCDSLPHAKLCPLHIVSPPLAFKCCLSGCSWLSESQQTIFSELTNDAEIVAVFDKQQDGLHHVEMYLKDGRSVNAEIIKSLSGDDTGTELSESIIESRQNDTGNELSESIIESRQDDTGTELSESIIESRQDAASQSVLMDESHMTLDVTGFSEADQSITCNGVISDADEKTISSVSELNYSEICIEERLEVTVCCVFSPSSFYIHKENSQDLNELLDSMYEFYTNSNSNAFNIDHVTVNMPCAAKFSEDASWYRARIKKIIDNNYVEVMFLDHGNVETCAKSDIRKLLCRFSELPLQAIECSLAGVRSKEGPWNTEAITLFENLTQDKSLLADIISIGDDNSCMVQLLHMGLSISERLIEEGYGMESTTPVSVSKKIKRVFSNSSDVASPASRLSEEEPGKAGDGEKSDESVLTDITEVPKELYHGRFSLVETKMDTDYTVAISHSENPGRFWCHLLDNVATLGNMMDDMLREYSSQILKDNLSQDTCKQSNGGTGTQLENGTGISTGTDEEKEELFQKHCQQLEDISINSSCLILFPVDGQYYRAVIQDINSDQTVTVLFVDFGNIETVSRKNVLVLDEKYCELPAQAIHCSLDVLNESWDTCACSRFDELTEDNELVIYVIEKLKNGSHLVQLFAGEVSIGGCLVQGGYAESAENLEDVFSDDIKSIFSPYSWTLLSTDMEYDITPIAVVNPLLFFVRLTDANDMSQIECEIQKYVNEDPQSLPSDTEAGTCCIALNSKKQEYQRAKILKVVSPTKVQVLFIDCCLKETVATTSIYKLPNSLSEIPSQVSPCCLTSILPVGSTWSKEAKLFFTDHVHDVSVMYVTRMNEDGIYSIVLECEGQKLNRLLVDLGYAAVDPDTTLFEELLNESSNLETTFDELVLERENSFGSSEDIAANVPYLDSTSELETTDTSFCVCQDSTLDTTGASDSFLYVNVKKGTGNILSSDKNEEQDNEPDDTQDDEFFDAVEEDGKQTPTQHDADDENDSPTQNTEKTTSVEGVDSIESAKQQDQIVASIGETMESKTEDPAGDTTEVQLRVSEEENRENLLIKNKEGAAVPQNRTDIQHSSDFGNENDHDAPQCFEKIAEDKTTVDTESDSHTENKTMAETERDSHAEDKTMAETERDSRAEDKTMAETERDSLAEDKTMAETERDSHAEDKTMEETERDSHAEDKTMEETERDSHAEDKTIAETEKYAEDKTMEDTERDSHAEDKSTAETERDSHTEHKTMAEIERDSHAEDKIMAEIERDSHTEDKTMAEIERDSQAEDKIMAEIERDSHTEDKTMAETEGDSQAEDKSTAETERDSHKGDKIMAETERDSQAEDKSTSETQRDSHAEDKTMAETERDSHTEDKTMAETERDTEHNTMAKTERGSHAEDNIMLETEKDAEDKTMAETKRDSHAEDKTMAQTERDAENKFTAETGRDAEDKTMAETVRDSHAEDKTMAETEGDSHTEDKSMAETESHSQNSETEEVIEYASDHLDKATASQEKDKTDLKVDGNDSS